MDWKLKTFFASSITVPAYLYLQKLIPHVIAALSFLINTLCLFLLIRTLFEFLPESVIPKQTILLDLR